MERARAVPIHREAARQATPISAEPAPARHAPESSLLRLQRAVGNKAFGRLIQAKLRVSQPGDAYELEADRVADQVMRMPGSGDQRGCAACASGKGVCSQCAAEAVQRRAAIPTITPLIQRELNACEIPQGSATSSSDEEKEEPIQRSAEGALYASSEIAERLRSSKGQGEPLPEPTRLDLGAKMGADFSGIRVHTDSRAVQMSRDLGAHAFTHGSDIYFNAGRYNPGTAEGKHLLVHELAHAMQQNPQNQQIVHRLAITVQSPLARRTCGGYSVRWIFALSNPAPEDGYIVQQIDEYKEILDCPAMGRCLARPTLTFWEAWFVRRGDTHEHLHSSMGFTDQDQQRESPRKVGFNVGTGEVKFYRRSVTGDLGRDGVAPATPNGGWGPGNAPLSGSLPSTRTRPTWWGTAPTEGPATRLAYAAWRCCNDAGDYNVIRAQP